MIRFSLFVASFVALCTLTFFVPPSQWYIVVVYISLICCAAGIGISFFFGWRISIYIGCAIAFLLFLFWQGIFAFEFVGLLILALLTSEVMYRIGIRMLQ